MMKASAALTQAALTILATNGVIAWRNNTTGVWDPNKQVFRKAKGVRNGIADIIGIRRKDGKFVAVEVKSGKDKMSPAQEEFKADIIRSGGIFIIVNESTDWDKFITLIKLI